MSPQEGNPMADDSNGNTRPPHRPTGPSRIFHDIFLTYLNERDEPLTAYEAEFAGNCHVERDPEGAWAVLREMESLAAGHPAVATFLHQEVAEIAAAALPGTRRRLRYRLGAEREERGFPVLFDGAVVGYLRTFDEGLVQAMTTIDALLASPRDFAWLLQALGGVAAERVETILVGRLR
jgi:hypothetical protein